MGKAFQNACMNAPYLPLGRLRQSVQISSVLASVVSRSSFLAVLILGFQVAAADVTGTWKAEFDTQIDLQKYSFELRQAGGKVTGKANSNIGGEKRQVELKETMDDPLGLSSYSLNLYRDWIAAKKPAELLMFAKGGHGFGMNKQNLPSDRWIERFADWLDFQGLLKR